MESLSVSTPVTVLVLDITAIPRLKAGSLQAAELADWLSDLASDFASKAVRAGTIISVSTEGVWPNCKLIFSSTKLPTGGSGSESSEAEGG